MHLINPVVLLILPLILVCLFVTAGFAVTFPAWSCGAHEIAVSLPISTMTSTATIILPVITAVTMRGTQAFTRRSREGREGAKLEFSWSAVIVLMLLVIYETAIATLALSHMAPPNDLSCHLERRWASLFSNKRANEIRRIQDRHQCCGLYSVQDRAWPFPDRSHTAAACHEVFDRQRSCFEAWRQDEQITGGLMLLVAVVAFLVKLLILVIYRNGNPFRSSTRSAFSSFATNGDEGVGNIRGRIGNAYQDDPSPETDGQMAGSQSHGESNGQGIYTGAVMLPSRLQRGGN